MKYPRLAVVALLLCGLAAGLVRLAAAPTAEPGRAVDVPAHYVVLVDISGSMGQPGRYPAMLAALPQLLEGLDRADRVSLYTFDSTVQPRYSGPALSGAELVAELPADATAAASTDLGQPIAVALDEMQRPGGAPIRTVVFVTDGMHDPPPGSEYAELSSPAWSELARRARATEDANTSIYTVLLGAGEFDDAQATRVFGSGTVLRPADSAALEDAFAAARDRVAAAKQRLAAVPPDAADAVESPPLGGGAEYLGYLLLAALSAVALLCLAAVVWRRRPVLSGTLQVSTGGESAIRIQLRGRHMTFDNRGIEGHGRVVPSRGAGPGRAPELKISYAARAGATPVTRRCVAGEPIILGGYTFTYRTDSIPSER